MFLDYSNMVERPENGKGLVVRLWCQVTIFGLDVFAFEIRDRLSLGVLFLVV